MPKSKDSARTARDPSTEDPLFRLLGAIKTRVIESKDWQGLVSTRRKTERSFEGVSLDDILHDVVISLWAEHKGQWTETQFHRAVLRGADLTVRRYGSRQRAASRHATAHEELGELYDTVPLSIEEQCISEEQASRFYAIQLKYMQHDADCMALLEALRDSQIDRDCPDFEFKDNAKIAAHLGKDLKKIENTKKRFERYYNKAWREWQNEQ